MSPELISTAKADGGYPDSDDDSDSDDEEEQVEKVPKSISAARAVGARITHVKHKSAVFLKQPEEKPGVWH